MLRVIYISYVSCIFFIKRLYRKKNKDNTTRAFILTFLLMFLNLHSILLFCELYLSFDIGIRRFWIPTSEPKAPLGYLFGAIICIIFYLLYNFIRKSITLKDKYSLNKRAVSITPRFAFTILYLVLTISMFVFFIAIMAIKNRVEIIS